MISYPIVMDYGDAALQPTKKILKGGNRNIKAPLSALFSIDTVAPPTLAYITR